MQCKGDTCPSELTVRSGWLAWAVLLVLLVLVLVLTVLQATVIASKSPVAVQGTKRNLNYR